ncbi:hypothetical protein V1517DRAFT_368825 [Lipomyces orientalis]|uniref:Uncharacterized protein n=1 Tax=Lipomyces orientalis TaxID=1233043 RepID=A0ACC3TJ04_9ASCO
MTAHRSLGRDIVIYLATDATVSIGGDDGRVRIQRTQDPLLPGEYEIENDGHIEVTDAPYYKRISSAMSSLSASGGVRSFPAAVRDRDRRCVITGVPRWTRYDATHIFAVALESMFHNYNFGELVVLDERDGSDVHGLFNQYEISINPNDDCRIVCFLDDALGLAGRQLDPICRGLEHPHHVNDDILFCHFQQAIIPPGSNMDAILSGPAPAERMEFELSSRLGDVMRAQGSLLIK